LLWLKVIVVQWTKRFSFFAPSISFESKPPCGQAAGGNKPEEKMTRTHLANAFMTFLESLFDSSYGRAVIDIPAQEGCIDGLGRLL
jgi:hypothetical protein